MKISVEQLEMLDIYSADSYVSELVVRCKNVFPLLYQTLGEKRLKLNISKLIKKAKFSNITQRGPIQLYFDMSVTLGYEFETDPMYSHFNFKLERYSSYNELDRSLIIYKIFDSYVGNVIGENGEYVRKFLEKLKGENFSSVKESGFVFCMYDLLSYLYPQKCAYLGQDAVFDSINYITERTKANGLSSKKRTAYIISSFIIGHEFEKDHFHLNDDFLNFSGGNDSFYILKSKEIITNFVNSLIL